MKNRYEKGFSGGLAEEIVVKYLIGKGYKIIDRNYRCPTGEIDIISQKDEYICFVEVRSRSSSSYGQPYETVTYPKQRKISKTAKYFISQNQYYYGKYSFRFDVASVVFCNNQDYSIEYIEGAFELIE
ncbi:MAG: YraN family protein [Deltaproteobacteria bacterium]|nr:YraN family protein [Deltaproteobacteria bacterium]